MSKNGQMKRRVRAKQVQKLMARKQEKERAQVAKHVLNLQQQQAGDQNPHIQDINRQLAALVQGHNELVTAYNANWKNFSESIRQLDARLGALFLVLDDLVRGGVDNVTKFTEADVSEPGHPAVGGIHMHAYVRLYLKRAEEEFAALKAQAEAAQPPPFDPLVTPPGTAEESEADYVFGGKEDSTNGEAQLQAGSPA